MPGFLFAPWNRAIEEAPLPALGGFNHNAGKAVGRSVLIAFFIGYYHGAAHKYPGRVLVIVYFYLVHFPLKTIVFEQ